MAALASPLRRKLAATELIIRHCLALGASQDERPPTVRLEEAVGPELARRLLASITVTSRR